MSSSSWWEHSLVESVQAKSIKSCANDSSTERSLQEDLKPGALSWRIEEEVEEEEEEVSCQSDTGSDQEHIGKREHQSTRAPEEPEERDIRERRNQRNDSKEPET